ncbi:hypothetical protein GAY31_19625 [Azospirillum brasilense]|nr:hypothetical protein [Azospirillum brasilense]
MPYNPDFDDEDEDDTPELVKPTPGAIPAITVDPAAIQALVVEQAVAGLVSRLCANTMLRDAVKSAAERAIEKQIDEAIQPVLNDLLSTVTLTKTNEWGEKKGEPMTIREFAAKTVMDSLNELVDYQGKPITDSYSRSSAKRRYVHIVEQMCSAEVRQEVAKAATSLKANVGQAFGELVKNALNDQLKLISGR